MAGITLVDAHGRRLAQSKKAAREAIGQVTLSRILMASPGMGEWRRGPLGRCTVTDDQPAPPPELLSISGSHLLKSSLVWRDGPSVCTPQ